MPARTETVVLKFEGQSASAMKAIGDIARGLQDLGRELERANKSSGGGNILDLFKQLGSTAVIMQMMAAALPEYIAEDQRG